MSILDRIFVGQVIKDFGPIEEKNLGLGKITTSALLVEKAGKLNFVLKNSGWFLVSGSFRYEIFTLEEASKLRECINESEQIARNLPPSTYDVNSATLRSALITTCVGSGIIALP